MKTAITFILLIFAEWIFAQSDTIVVYDYTKIMVSTQIEKGEVTPIINLEDLSQAGFFLHSLPKGMIKVCNTGKFYVWANGHLVKKIDECDFLSPANLYSKASSDTVFVSFTVKNSFSNFKCELLRLGEFQVLQDDVLLNREIRNSFSEFTILSIIVILGLFGVLAGLHPSRVAFIMKKSFSLKTNTYEFINTSFISSPSLIATTLFSFTLGFLSVYLNELLELSILNKSQSTTGFLMSWIQFSIIVFITLFVKRLLIELMSKLFHFKDWNNYQLFDFINFNIFLFSLITLVVVIDFVCFSNQETMISSNILISFPAVLILFLVWFSLKFVNHSPRKKLVIISYLCATEIIPAVFLLSWFFK